MPHVAIITSASSVAEGAVITDIPVLARATLTGVVIGPPLEADDITFPAATGIVNGVVLADDTGDDSASPILGFWDYTMMGGLSLALSIEEATVTWPAAGLLDVDGNEIEGGSLAKPGVEQTLRMFGHPGRPEEALLPGLSTLPGLDTLPAAGLTRSGIPSLEPVLQVPGLFVEVLHGAHRFLLTNAVYPPGQPAQTRHGTPFLQNFWVFVYLHPWVSISTQHGVPTVVAYEDIDLELEGQDHTANHGLPIVTTTPTATLILPARAFVRWHLVLGASDGTKLMDISLMARDVRMGWYLNRPETMTFRLPADEPRLRQTYGGLPYLHPLVRFVWGYREETVSATNPTPINRLRFVGTVWQVHARGDAASNPSVAVTVMGHLHLLTKRVCVDANGYTLRALPEGSGTAGPIFQAAPADSLRAVMDNSRDKIGSWPIDLGPAPGGTNYLMDFQRKLIWDALVQVTEMYDGCDIQVTRFENGRIQVDFPRRAGVDRPHTIFSWGGVFSNCADAEQLFDPETYANRLYVIGTQTAAGYTGTPFAVGPVNYSAVGQYGAFEAVSEYPDVTGSYVSTQPGTYAQLQVLGQEELGFRSQMRRIVSWRPQAGRAPEPFRDYDLGDTVRVFAREDMFGGFSGVQRVYGFDLSLSGEAVERVETVVTTP